VPGEIGAQGIERLTTKLKRDDEILAEKKRGPPTEAA
jgi:hypothetical protein